MRPITPSNWNITRWYEWYELRRSRLWLFKPNYRLVSVNVISRYFRFQRDRQPGPLGTTPDFGTEKRGGSLNGEVTFSLDYFSGGRSRSISFPFRSTFPRADFPKDLLNNFVDTGFTGKSCREWIWRFHRPKVTNVLSGLTGSPGGIL